MSQLPLVSIVIPVYNGGNYLAAAIDSALAQTWPAIDVIVVDDGSDDEGETARICDRYGKKIRYLHKPNGGVATALNLAILSMEGEYFSWLSHDDLYAPDRIETMVGAVQDFLSRRGGSLPPCAYSDFDLIDHEGRHLSTHRRQGTSHGPVGPEEIMHGVNGCTVLVPKVCFDRAGLFHPRLPTTQDADMWSRLFAVTEFIHVPRVTVFSRRHEAQGSRKPWHLVERYLHRWSLFDRGLSASLDFLRQEARQSPLPGVRRAALGRIALRESRLPVTLIWGSGRCPLSLRQLRRFRRRGIEIRPVEIEPQTTAAIIQRCARAEGEWVWLQEKKLFNAYRKLRRAIAYLGTRPDLAGGLLSMREPRSPTALGAFGSVLLRARAGSELAAGAPQHWASLAHAAMRAGGLERIAQVGRASRWKDQQSTEELSVNVEEPIQVPVLEQKPDVVILCPEANLYTRRVARNLALQLVSARSTLLLEAETAAGEAWRMIPLKDPDPPVLVAGEEVLSALQSRNLQRVVVVLEDVWPRYLLQWEEVAGVPFDAVTLAGSRQAGDSRIPHPGTGCLFTLDPGAATGLGPGAAAAPPDPGHLATIRPWYRTVLPGESCRIAIFGQPATAEGLKVPERLLKLIRRRGLPFELRLFGHFTEPQRAAKRMRPLLVETRDDEALIDAVSAFDPHLAWVPGDPRGSMTLPLMDAAMCGLPLLTADTDHARNYLCDRDLTWFAPPEASPEEWLKQLERICARQTANSWNPRDPLEVFPARDNQLARYVLQNL